MPALKRNSTLYARVQTRNMKWLQTKAIEHKFVSFSEFMDAWIESTRAKKSQRLTSIKPGNGRGAKKKSRNKVRALLRAKKK